MNELARHCLEIDRCNQRGGRMLSIVDLLEAGTLTPELAAYLAAALRQGASFMVGALPGGAGKTTVMCALLNFVPPGIELRPADGPPAIAAGLKERSMRRCYICHEIGPGDYYAYLWGEELRAYFQLAEAGHLLATNLHADTFEEARDQVCLENEVPAENFQHLNLVLFLRVLGGWRGHREIVRVWESNAHSPHRLVFNEQTLALDQSRLITRTQFESAAARLEQLCASGARSIEEVRAFVERNPL